LDCGIDKTAVCKHCDVHVQDGVVLGADTRATADDTIADKNSKKLDRISDMI